MNEKKSSYLIGFLVGGLIGAAIALVLAPQTGSSTRSRFSNHVATLNRRISHDSSEKELSSLESDAESATKTDTTTTYEPPKITLEEGLSASVPPPEKS